MFLMIAPFCNSANYGSISPLPQNWPVRVLTYSAITHTSRIFSCSCSLMRWWSSLLSGARRLKRQIGWLWSTTSNSLVGTSNLPVKMPSENHYFHTYSSSVHNMDMEWPQIQISKGCCCWWFSNGFSQVSAVLWLKERGRGQKSQKIG